MPQGFHEVQDIRTKKALKHQKNALKSKAKGISNIPFNSYEAALKWIDAKSKEYGGKGQFLASEEYQSMYPKIKKLYDKEQKEHGDESLQALKEVNQNYGDRVFYDFVSPFGYVESYRGTIVKRSGVPYVRLDEKISGRRFLKWHKGWILEKAVE